MARLIITADANSNKPFFTELLSGEAVMTMKWEEMITPVIDEEERSSLRAEGLEKGKSIAVKNGISEDDTRLFAEIYAEEFILQYEEGFNETRHRNMKNIIETMGLTVRQAMDALLISPADQKRYRPLL